VSVTECVVLDLNGIDRSLFHNVYHCFSPSCCIVEDAALLDLHNLLRLDGEVYISNIKGVKPKVYQEISNNGANVREIVTWNDRPRIMDRPEKYGRN
jgi:hypothetical protein